MRLILYKASYIKYVGGEGGRGGGGFYKFFKRNFVAQETIDLNIYGPVSFSENSSWPLPSILVSYLSLTCSGISW